MTKSDKTNTHTCLKCGVEDDATELEWSIRWDRPDLCLLDAFCKSGSALYCRVCSSCKWKIRFHLIASMIVVILLGIEIGSALFDIRRGLMIGLLFALFEMLLVFGITAVVKSSDEYKRRYPTPLDHQSNFGDISNKETEDTPQK